MYHLDVDASGFVYVVYKAQDENEFLWVVSYDESTMMMKDMKDLIEHINRRSSKNESSKNSENIL